MPSSLERTSAECCGSRMRIVRDAVGAGGIGDIYGCDVCVSVYMRVSNEFRNFRLSKLPNGKIADYDKSGYQFFDYLFNL